MLRRLFDVRVFRFLLVGVLNSLFGFVVFSTIAYLGGHTWLALLGGNVAGIVFNFLTIGGIVFRDLSARRLLRFIAAYLGLFLLNLEAISSVTRGIEIDRILAQALLTAPMAVLSYLIMSKFVFAGHNGVTVGGEPDPHR
ncbi:GtrA family protein [Bordetella sp. LUAb4]|uniref:GtrA family protein n=1 Tax=Bordetella sp. LUAb4 TaxID=2843195 RepID=UPI001E2C1392|nr:GtrA family protein [Bordetella sp. LUAb4]